jgi:hypothetical protein
VAKEFLREQGVEFESVDVRESPERWEAAGRPIVPSLAVDGVLSPILHVSQLAEALGLEPPPGGDAARLARECGELLDAWLAELAPLPWETVVAPTPSRGRTLRELTVNVFHPFELLAEARESGDFQWRPELDAERETRFGDTAGLLGWATSVRDDWRAYVAGAPLDEGDPPVGSPRGSIPYSALLDSHRTHAAFHLRQLGDFLGRPVPLLERLHALALPADVF